MSDLTLLRRDADERMDWLLYEFSGLCGICGQELDLDDLHIDHIVPRGRGGGNERTNLQPAHNWCNQRKGDKLLYREQGEAWCEAHQDRCTHASWTHINDDSTQVRIVKCLTATTNWRFT